MRYLLFVVVLVRLQDTSRSLPRGSWEVCWRRLPKGAPTMRVRDILRRKGAEVVTISPTDSVHEAVEALVKHNIGSLVVTASNRTVVGIISERDILRDREIGN